MGGPHDSSLTRVQPAFDQLANRSAPWLENLCRLGSRSNRISLPIGSEVWEWEAPPSYEYSCLSPLDYLEYLLVNANDPGLLAQEKITSYHGEVREKREALFAGDPSVREEGLRRLREPEGRKSRKGAWQVLEGTTKVDCALFARGVTLFVEGKRTEPHLTDSTQWHRQRHQVIRNLDCLRVERRRASHWFVLLVVEEDTRAAMEAVDLDDDIGIFRDSLPHLTDREADDVRGRYLGYTTWQAIQHRFQLDPYPDLIEPTSRRRSRKCPECSTTGLPIVYGLPPYYPFGVAEERGLLVLAGCVISEDSPTWRCPDCGDEWDGPDPARAIRAAIRQVETEGSP